MEITGVHIIRVGEAGAKLRAYASITFDSCFVVRDLKVIAGHDGGLFVAMPSKKRKDGHFADIAHPLNAATRVRIEEAILAAYERSKAAAPA